MSNLSDEDIFNQSLDEYLEIINEPISTFIKNRDALRPTYIPHEILFRKVEKERILKTTKPLFLNSEIPHLTLYGTSGTGKTAIMRNIEKAIPYLCKEKGIKTISTAYVDCKGATQYSILIQIMQSMGMKISRRRENINLQYNEFTNNLEDNQHQVLIVLDDFDKTKEGVNKECLFNFTRIPYFNFVMIVNNLNFIQELPPHTKSSFSPRYVSFEKYKTSQLSGILNQRIELAFSNNIITSKALDFMIKLSALTGDARYGISLLRESVNIVEDDHLDKIDLTIVEKAKKAIETEEAKEIISKRSYRHLIGFYTVLLKQNGQKLATTSDLYDQYIKLEEAYSPIPIVSRKQFGRDLEDIARDGLIFKKEGYANRWGVCKYYDEDELRIIIKKEISEKSKAWRKEDFLGISETKT